MTNFETTASHAENPDIQGSVFIKSQLKYQYQVNLLLLYHARFGWPIIFCFPYPDLDIYCQLYAIADMLKYLKISARYPKLYLSIFKF